MDMSKVIQLQLRLKAPKSQTNNFGNYQYRNLESILTAAKPLLNELGLLLHISDELVMVGDRYYIKATARLYDTESPGNALESYGWAREAETKKGMDVSQITGSASSYARKIAVGSLLLIDDTKDADTLNDNKDYNKPEEPIPLTAEQTAELDRLLEATGTDLTHMMEAFSIKTIDHGNYKGAIHRLELKLAAMDKSKGASS